MIDVLVPTYGRPERMEKMYLSCKGQAGYPSEVTVHALIEPTDPKFPEYMRAKPFDRAVVPSDSLNSAAKAWNYLVDVTSNFIVHMAADDLVYVTKDWDLLVRDDFVRKPYRVLHYRDDLRDERMALNPFVTREYIKEAGFIHPDLLHFYSDTWIEDIGRRAGTLYYNPNIHIKQEHPKNGLAPMDDTYMKTRNNGIHQHDHSVWIRTEEERARLAAKVANSAGV